MAPQVALYPAAGITGTISTIIGTPATNRPTCVIAVFTGGPTDPTCTPDTTAGTCADNRSSGVYCVLTDATGHYNVTGLVHGSYTVYVVPTDPEYVRPAGVSILLGLGVTQNYDASINRRARVIISALAPNTTTNALEPAVGATAAFSPQPTITPVAVTDGTGRTTAYGARPRVVPGDGPRCPVVRRASHRTCRWVTTRKSR